MGGSTIELIAYLETGLNTFPELLHPPQKSPRANNPPASSQHVVNSIIRHPGISLIGLTYLHIQEYTPIKLNYQIGGYTLDETLPLIAFAETNSNSSN
jgi:hypothetical protein